MEGILNGGGPLDDDDAVDDGMMDGIESHQMNVWVGVLCRYVCKGYCATTEHPFDILLFSLSSTKAINDKDNHN